METNWIIRLRKFDVSAKTDTLHADKNRLSHDIFRISEKKSGHAENHGQSNQHYRFFCKIKFFMFLCFKKLI